MLELDRDIILRETSNGFFIENKGTLGIKREVTEEYIDALRIINRRVLTEMERELKNRYENTGC